MIWALHGAMGTTQDWSAISSLLAAKGETVRAVDLYRYQNCCPMGLEEFGRAFCEEVAAVDSEPVLLGYSMGGRLGLHALLHCPSMWKGAVIVSAHPGLTDEKEKIMRMARDSEWAATALQKDWSDFLKDWDEQEVLAGQQATDRSSLRLRKTEVVRSMMEWTLGKQKDLRAGIAQLDFPLTWMTGELDEKFTNLAGSLQVKEKIIVQNAGHRLYIEAAEKVVAAVNEVSENRLNYVPFQSDRNGT